MKLFCRRALLVFLALFALSACGGGSSSADSTESTDDSTSTSTDSSSDSSDSTDDSSDSDDSTDDTTDSGDSTDDTTDSGDSTDDTTDSGDSTDDTTDSGDSTDDTTDSGDSTDDTTDSGDSTDDTVDTSTCTTPTSTTLIAAYDEGYYDDSYSPDKAIDGDYSDDESRWSSEGSGRWLIVDLGEAYDIREIRTAWYKATERTSYFDLDYSLDGSTWSVIGEDLESTGVSGLESWTVDSADGRYVRLTGYGNSVDGNNWNSLLEIEVSDCGTTDSVTEELVIEVEEDTTDGTEPGDTVDTPDGTPSEVLTYDLDASLAPSDNFDLTRWYLSVPTDTDDSGTADSIYEAALNAGYENDDYFYTGDDGGMVFVCPIYGYKTSTNTSYTRVELRGMLRAGDTSISTQGVNGNNWVFSSAPISAQEDAGGVDGTLKATLAVNHVTDTLEDGNTYSVGRIVIGQIHADDDEPIRLYYRKLPDNTNGSIYFAHEPTDDSGYDEVWIEVIGSKDSDADNPEDGIALDEVFSYEINVVGNTLTLSILRDGKDTVTKSISMNGSGYAVDDDYMYFKAGVYMADKLQDDYDTYDSDDERLTDYGQVTFYALEATHDSVSE